MQATASAARNATPAKGDKSPKIGRPRIDAHLRRQPMTVHVRLTDRPKVRRFVAGLYASEGQPVSDR